MLKIWRNVRAYTVNLDVIIAETKSLLFFKTLVTGFWNATAQAKSPYTLIPSTVTNNE